MIFYYIMLVLKWNKISEIVYSKKKIEIYGVI